MKSERSSDTAFRTLLVLGGIAVSVLLIAIFVSLTVAARRDHCKRISFLTGSEWDPVTSSFHSLAFVVGTLITSLIALVVATILSLPWRSSWGIFPNGRLQRDHAHCR